jgi:hypothetical protein
MDEDAESRVSSTRSYDRRGHLDWLRKLPDSLLCQVFLNLPTKDVVKTSVLSSTWGNIWRSVPGLDLGYGDFPEYNAFVSFVDSFLGFNSESRLQNFKLNYQYLRLKYEWKWTELDNANVTRWINTVIKRKVEHLHVTSNSNVNWNVNCRYLKQFKHVRACYH